MLLITAVQGDFKWHWEELPRNLRDKLGKTDVFSATPFSIRLGFRGIISIIRELHHLIQLRAVYDVFLFHGHTFASLFLPLFRRLPFIDLPLLVFVEFNMREDDGSFRSMVKYLFLRLAYADVDLVFPFSQIHADYLCRKLKWPSKKVVPVFQPAFYGSISSIEPHFEPGDYIVIPGRTGRDFAILERALHSVSDPVLIVTSSKNLRAVRLVNKRKNVKIELDVSLYRYVELLAHAKYVVVLLQDSVHPTGMRTLFMAMSLGKACIVSATRTVLEYFSQYNAPVIMIPPGDANALRKAMYQLNENPGKITELGHSARAFVEDKLSSQQYVSEVIGSVLDRF